MGVFDTALVQMVSMFLFMAVGYVLRRLKLMEEDAGRTLANLVVYVFGPCMSVGTLAQKCTFEVLVYKLPLLGTSIALLFMLMIPVSRILAGILGREEKERAVYSYSLCFANFAYLGYPIVGEVYGEDVLMDMIIFCIPMTIAVVTYGLGLLTPDSKFSFKTLLNPSAIAPFIGIAIGLTEVRLPSVVKGVLEWGGDCMAPVAMVLIGFVLAGRPLKGLFQNWRAYVASLLRLLFIPLFAAGILYLLEIRGEILLVASVALAMPIGSNSVVFPEAFGGDAASGAQAVLISNLMGIITIPLVMSFFQNIAF